MGNRRLVSLRAGLVFVLISALSVGGFFLVRGGIERQDRALLSSDTAQVELLLQSTLQNLQQQLRSVSFFTISSPDRSAAFAQQAKALAAGRGSSVAVVDNAANPPNVVVATGEDMHAGKPLRPALARFAAAAGTSLSSTVIRVGARTLLLLASSSTVYPHDVTVETVALHPSTPVPNTSQAYAHIYVNVYAVPTRGPKQLIITTFGPRPIPAPTASAVLHYGSVRWLVLTAQKSPLAGSYAQATPWIALLVGMAVALAVALVFEILARRQRHVEALVTDRTTALYGAQQELVRNERLIALGEFAGVVGHELRNPLSAAVNELFLARLTLEDRLDSDSAAHMDRAEGQIYRAAKLSGDLTAYTRERDLDIGDIDFSALVDEVLDTTPAPEGVTVGVGDTTHFDADRSLMAQVITNLVTNAYQAMPHGGSVRLGAVDTAEGTRITVQDSGLGFDPGVGHRLFDPFFSSKDEGTGLGLAIVQRLVTLHGGHVSITNVPGGGARVTIGLPPRSGQQPVH